MFITVLTKSLTKKQMKKHIAEIRDPAGFENKMPRQKANTITTELKGGPSDLGTKFFTKIHVLKNHPYTLKAFGFSLTNPQ